MRSAGARLAALTCGAALGAGASFAAEPDYGGYQVLLANYLGRVEVNRKTVLTGFDYQGLRNREGHADAEAYLGMIRRQLLAVPPSAMTVEERTAWGINLYNLLVVQQVARLLGPPERPLKSVMDVKGFFDAPVVEVEGVPYSLNAFERHFLFADFDRKSDTPPATLDPRVHFAIVCAARGCPILALRPYRAATLGRDLDANTRASLGTNVHARMDRRTGRFAISSVFDWYEKDFGGRAGVVKFLERYGPTPLRLAFGSWGADALRGFIPWDWRLNQPSPWAPEDEAPR